MYFWYPPRLVCFAADLEGEAPPVFSSSSTTRLFAASMHDDCICKERGPVGLGKASVDGLGIVFLKYASRAIIASIRFSLHLRQLACYIPGRPAGHVHAIYHHVTCSAPCALRGGIRDAYSNFREKNFREWEDNHENHENILPRKFGAIRYIQIVSELCSLFISSHPPS